MVQHYLQVQKDAAGGKTDLPLPLADICSLALGRHYLASPPFNLWRLATIFYWPLKPTAQPPLPAAALQLFGIAQDCSPLISMLNFMVQSKGLNSWPYLGSLALKWTGSSFIISSAQFENSAQGVWGFTNKTCPGARRIAGDLDHCARTFQGYRYPA